MGNSDRVRPLEWSCELVSAAESVVAGSKAARKQAKLAAFMTCWDTKREALRPLPAEAAPEIAAAQHALSVATMLYGLSA
jgi:hypothetical protein